MDLEQLHPDAQQAPEETVPQDFTTTDDRARDARLRTHRRDGLAPSDVPPPVIGAIPFGGTVQQAGTVTLAAGASVTIGDTGDARAAGTVVAVRALVAATLEVVGEAGGIGSTTLGYELPVTLLELPVRRLTVRGIGAGGTLAFMVLSFDRG